MSDAGAAPLPAGSPTLDIVVSLRACVPQLGAPELAIGLRLLQTFQDYSRSHAHWQTRPQVRFAVGHTADFTTARWCGRPAETSALRQQTLCLPSPRCVQQ